MMGMSRSSTCVLAYLMLKKEMTAVQALQEVRRLREVKPNDGFLRQLADLDNKLRKEREKVLADKNPTSNNTDFHTTSDMKKTKPRTPTSCLSSNLSSNGTGRKPTQSVTWK